MIWAWIASEESMRCKILFVFSDQMEWPHMRPVECSSALPVTSLLSQLKRLPAVVVVTVSLAIVPVTVCAQGKLPEKLPKDGGGIKWSTIGPQVRKVKLASGQEVDEQARWKLNGQTLYGFDVELEKPITVGGTTKTKIKVWVAPKEAAEDADKAVKENYADYLSYCHGVTFGNGLYNPRPDDVPFILEAGYEKVECNYEHDKKGDVVTITDKDGKLDHTAVSNGDGTYTSKDNFHKQENSAKWDDVKKPYDNAVFAPLTFDCYRPKKP
jgi:hypothetical protein